MNYTVIDDLTLELLDTPAISVYLVKAALLWLYALVSKEQSLLVSGTFLASVVVTAIVCTFIRHS